MMLDLVAKAQGKSKPLHVIPKKITRGPNASVYPYNGSEYSLCELSEKCGISPATLRSRLISGWSVDDAMTTALQKRPVK